MKNLFQKILGSALIACITLSLSSCEELFGEWSKPVPASVVQEAKVLGAALETGAKVSVNYSVGSKNYVATFIKNSDDSYTLISNTYISGARAMTRDASPIPFTVPTGDAAAVGSNIQLVLVGGKLQLTVKDTNGTPLFEAQMNVDGGEVVVLNTNAAGIDCSVGSVAVNDQPQPIKIPEMKTVNLTMGSGDSKVSYAVKYSQENNETWAAVIERYNNLDVVEIKANKDYISVMFSKDFVVKSLMEAEVDQAIAEEMYNYHFSGEFYLTSNDPIAEGHSFVPKYVKTTDVVGIVDGQDQATYYLTTQVPIVATITVPIYELSNDIYSTSANVTLNIPLGDNLTWNDIIDFNDGKIWVAENDNQFTHIVATYQTYTFLVCGNEFVKPTSTYNPEANYQFYQSRVIMLTYTHEGGSSGSTTSVINGLTWSELLNINRFEIQDNKIIYDGMDNILKVQVKVGDNQWNDVTPSDVYYDDNEYRYDLLVAGTHTVPIYELSNDTYSSSANVMLNIPFGDNLTWNDMIGFNGGKIRDVRDDNQFTYIAANYPTHVYLISGNEFVKPNSVYDPEATYQFYQYRVIMLTYTHEGGSSGSTTSVINGLTWSELLNINRFEIQDNKIIYDGMDNILKVQVKVGDNQWNDVTPSDVYYDDNEYRYDLVSQQ